MDQHKVMKLWTAIVTAFLALCTALGLITTTASTAAAAEQPETTPKRTAPVPAQPTSPWSRVHARSLPPTMKQRIRAEAHGKTPACRHRPTADSPSLAADPQCVPAGPPARPTIPLQR
ncbi:DUF6344 domain-containing protein [Streptomyces triticisoli]|jgi:hypothetical protein|uniref:DUF6344 domain-containing protein n=1 Tax=Streptomyces triticisoli TaxID=2182797 RepID=UPI000DD99050|nr:DUF6344 domain-containing protein [Streptomyces triticisoli]